MGDNERSWSVPVVSRLPHPGMAIKLIGYAVLGSLFLLAWKSAAVQSPTRGTGVQGNFVDITSASGIHFQHVASHTSRKHPLEVMGSGVGLFDYDNDGLLDIFLVNGARIPDPAARGTVPEKNDPKYWNRLYHQKKDGNFEDVTQKAGLQGAGYGMGVAVGDYDNDGYEDLYVTSYGGNRLYHNNGDGTFTDVTAKAGVGGAGWSSSATWVDLDNDGWLDLVVVRYVDWDFDDHICLQNREIRTYCDPSVFNRNTPLVYHNEGNGHFTEVSRKIGIAKPGKGLGVAISDYDRDGHIDVYISNDQVPGFLYRNKGDGTFEETGASANVGVDDNGHTYAGMGIDFADYNNDGLPDIAVDDLALQSYALYQNKGDGSFDYVTIPSGLGAMTMQHSGWGLRFIDYDNDGWKDLLIAQGHVLPSIEFTNPRLHYREFMMLARNTGQKFVEVSEDSGTAFHEAIAGRGLVVGDLNNDGRLDAVVTTNDGPAYVLRNETKTDNHWLLLTLVGHKSNRDAIGAEVKITTRMGSQFATVTTAGSYCSSNDKRVHFGLGLESLVRTVEIRWPSGIVQRMKDVRGDRILQVDEPTASESSQR